MNPFICITSNGGYIGRWCWCNAGTNGSNAGREIASLLLDAAGVEVEA
jgi:hypothetical protein